MCSYACYSKVMFSMFLIQEIRKGLYHITPLGEAVLGRNVDVSIVLMENGADVLFKSGVSSCDKKSFIFHCICSIGLSFQYVMLTR